MLHGKKATGPLIPSKFCETVVVVVFAFASARFPEKKYRDFLRGGCLHPHDFKSPVSSSLNGKNVLCRSCAE